MEIKELNRESFAPYGTVLEHDGNTAFQIAVDEPDEAGWRIALSRIDIKEIKKLGAHESTRESFLLLEGQAVILVAHQNSPDKMELFRLSRGVCLFKNVWHAVCCLSEYALFCITENSTVTSLVRFLDNPIQPYEKRDGE